jgi:hypothetical protein
MQVYLQYSLAFSSRLFVSRKCANAFASLDKLADPDDETG